jgi:DNA polymerase I-like protein with 3'-5' exonuclease and polymerase domains
MDVNGMHPRILAYILGYNLPNNDVYEFFSMVYKTDRQNSKEITFKQLYGGIWEEYLHHEFFDLAQKYTNSMWEQFNINGYIECPISKHKFIKGELNDMNPSKLLNYILQATETSINILILYNILKQIKGYKSKIILYVYDSILIDIDQNEKNEIIQIITQEYSKFNLPLNIKIGENYHSLIISP